MATLTKKDLLEAIEDMPMDAKIHIEIWDYGTVCTALVSEVKYDDRANTIDLC